MNVCACAGCRFVRRLAARPCAESVALDVGVGQHHRTADFRRVQSFIYYCTQMHLLLTSGGAWLADHGWQVRFLQPIPPFVSVAVSQPYSMLLTTVSAHLSWENTTSQCAVCQSPSVGRWGGCAVCIPGFDLLLMSWVKRHWLRLYYWLYFLHGISGGVKLRFSSWPCTCPS